MKVLPQIFKVLLFMILLSSCAGRNVLTEDEVILQQKATNALTSILFEYELDENASFEVMKNGFVNLRIQGFVSVKTYTKAIEELRAHKDIDGVFATQGGVEVCPNTIM